MKMNMDALKALELKLAEYSKANGAIAEYDSSNMNKYCIGCEGGCYGHCLGSCSGTCSGGRR